LYTWRRELLGEETCSVKKPPDEQQEPGNRDELQREVENLQERVHRLQLEHDILKKANELFSDHAPYLKQEARYARMCLCEHGNLCRDHGEKPVCSPRPQRAPYYI